MDITINIRPVYGQLKAYPVSDAAKALAEIAGTTTLTKRTLQLAETMGHKVVVASIGFTIEDL